MSRSAIICQWFATVRKVIVCRPNCQDLRSALSQRSVGHFAQIHLWWSWQWRIIGIGRGSTRNFSPRNHYINDTMENEKSILAIFLPMSSNRIDCNASLVYYIITFTVHMSRMYSCTFCLILSPWADLNCYSKYHHIRSCVSVAIRR